MDIVSLSTQFYYDCYAQSPQNENTDSEPCKFNHSTILYPHNIQCNVKITGRYLSVSDQKKLQVKVLLRDILGCRIVGSIKQVGSAKSSVVILNAMVRVSRRAPSNIERDTPRRRLEQAFQFDGADCMEVANQFCDLLHQLCTQVLVDGAIAAPRFSVPLLIVINPKSGSGQSANLFQSEVKALLLASKIRFEVLYTEYAGHAMKHLETCALDNFSGIVTIGGDGIIFEVINALLSRPDWQTARKIPIGVLPGGSGNALATAIAYAAGECFRHDLLQSNIYALCKNEVLPLDLLLYQTSKRLLFGFLEFSWGFIADVDIESESLRIFGGLRFQLYAIQRILFKRIRRARLTYLPYDPSEVSKDADYEISDHRKFRHLPPLGEAFPADDKRWKTIETEFYNIVIQNRSFLINDSYILPEFRRFDPGYMLAIILHQNIPRLDIIKLMLAEEIVDAPHVQQIRMTAFRFEPLDDTPSLLVVDGEKVDYGPIQAEILPRAGRIFGILNK